MGLRYYLSLVLAGGLASSFPSGNEQFILNAPAKFSSAAVFLAHADKVLQEVDIQTQEATWAYETNITDANEARSTQMSLKFNEVLATLIAEASLYSPSNSNEERLLTLLKNMGGGIPASRENQQSLAEKLTTLTSIYSTAKYGDQSLEPELTEVLASSRDYDTLLNAYIGWRNVTGPKMKPLYAEFVKLYNQGARDTGFKNAGEFWRAGYDMDVEDFEDMIESIWQEVLPLYEQLHCYAGEKLSQQYGKERVESPDGLLPAHLFGNMWSQDWIYINDLLTPFPDVPPVDVTPALKEQKYDAVKMHKLAEDFYVSLGYDHLPDSFWETSMLTKPNDREVVCHASAWDLNNNDLRIKMCTVINSEDVQTVHHEQGHLFYDHSYRNQPKLYREGAADFFHEAIGDTVVLSFLVPKHLQEIGLLPADIKDNYEQTINSQMGVALSKIPILPWTYLLDLWRWKVFSGEISPEEYQSKWTDLVEKYQGLKRPAEATADDFDPGAKYHVASNVPYIRYFGAAVLQFQFHEALCKAADYKGPIHKCSIYKSEAAGERFLEMLSMGKSKKWQDAIKTVTHGHSDSLDAKPMIKYFKPLLHWLKKQNRGKMCGWGDRRRKF